LKTIESGIFCQFCIWQQANYTDRFLHTQKKKLDSISLFSKQQTNKLKSIVIHGCMVGMITATISKTDNNPARNLSITDQVPIAT
jgi:hypothetical protein